MVRALYIHYTLVEPLLANVDTSGNLFEVCGGWAAQLRWQRTGGHGFPANKQLLPEDILSKWSVITNFGKASAAVNRDCC